MNLDKNKGKSRSIINIYLGNIHSITIPTIGIHVPVGKTTSLDCEMVKKSPDIVDGPVTVKMKAQRDDYLS